MEILDTTGHVLRINAPEWFKRPPFRALLDRGTRPDQRQRIATFHRHGDAPNAWSDVFVPFDAYPVEVDDDGNEVWIAEGSDIDGTEELVDVWQAITHAVQVHRIEHGIVWISNLGRD